MNPVVLVVDDDDAFRELVADILRPGGYAVHQASNAKQALELLAATNVDLVLTDQRMPGLSGLELTERVCRAPDSPAVIVMTAYGTIPQAVEAVRAGAADYLTKPLASPDALRQLVRRVLGERDQRGENQVEFITRAPRVLDMLVLADRAAATDATVLITGESGTGKELLAHRVHRRSRRSGGPFVAVNCAAIPQSLAESELFGHERGAFTGADRARRGRFEDAGGGTLFLDEIGELDEAVQAKMLRVLEERAIERVGSGTPVPVDIRLVVATNRDLEAEVAAGRFRSDLFYRLNVVHLAVPPLRERPGDLELLTPLLAEAAARRLGIVARPLAPTTMARLREHPWPGNVRELRNVLERALIAAAGDQVMPSDLPGLGAAEPTAPALAQAGAEHLPLSLEERERQAILDALERSDGHRERAAALLGISIRTLYNRLKQYGIS